MAVYYAHSDCAARPSLKDQLGTMQATQDNDNGCRRSLRPRKPKEVGTSDGTKENQNGKTRQEPSVARAVRRRGSKLSRSSSKNAAKIETSESTEAVVNGEGRLGSQSWTDKYKPSTSCPFVGNDSAVHELRSWLVQWKKKHSDPERSGSRHDAFSDSEESSEGLSNCYLLAGPPGVGKTSSVYYLAEELGFKVLEVHASSERPGKKILAQLHEATQSHHVEGSRLPFVACAVPQPVSAEKAKPRPKPKHVGPLQMMFEKAHAKSQEKPAKVTVESRPKVPKKGTLDSFFSTNNKNPAAKEPATKTSPKGTLLDYFAAPPAKKGNCASEATTSKRTTKRGCDTGGKISATKAASSAASDDDVEVVAVIAETPARATAKRKPLKRACSLSDSDEDFVVASEARPRKAAAKQQPAEKAKAFLKKQKAEQPCESGPLQPVLPAKKSAEQDSSTLKFSSLTIILFDDVDTIFEQDDGFWSAVESVLSTTKKPVVFTATRNLANVKAKLPSGCPIARFVHPSPDQVAKLVTHICNSEAISVPLGENISFLLQYYHCDVRKCILQLQFDSVLCVLEQGTPFSARDLPVGDDLCKLLQSEALDTRVSTQCMFEDLGLDVTHLCLPSVLPLTAVPVATPLEEDSNDEADAAEAHSALDYSWLSDVCEPESACESSQDNRVTEVHPQAPLIKQCLHELANMLDAFSDVDCMHGCFEKCAYSACCMLPSDRIEAWQNGKTASPLTAGAGEFPLPFAVSAALNYIKVGSVKLATSNLARCLDGSKDAIPELNVAVSSSVPSMTNIYQIAEQNRFWGRCRQQIVDSGVPVGAALSSAAVSDYTGALQVICKAEKLRKCLKAKRAQRFLHYLNSCGIFLPDDIMVALCRGFGAKSCV